jgi:predicted transcriptional regulator
MKPEAIELDVDDRDALLRAIHEGIQDADAGRVMDDAQARERLEAKFGPIAS